MAVDSRERWGRWLVYGVVGVALAASALATDRYVHRLLDRNLEAEAERLAERKAFHLQDFVDARVQALEQLRLAVEDGSLEPTDEEAFVPRAELIQARLPGYQAINWLDADGVFRVVVPLEGNAGLVGETAAAASNRATAALEDARRGGGVALSRPKELRQGGVGVVAYLPVRRDGEVVGFINAAFRVRALARALLRHEADDAFAVRISDGRETIFASEGWADPSPHVQAGRRGALVAGRPWVVSVRPTASHHGTLSQLELPHYLLGLALLVCLMVAVWVAVRRSSERRVARRQLRLLERAVREARDCIGICDVRGRMLYVNASGRRMLGLDDDEVQGSTLRDLVGELDGTDVDAVWQALQRSEIWRGRGQLRRPEEGEPVPVDLIISAIHGGRGGAVSGYAAVARDRREQERLEKQLRQAQKMEAVGQLAGGVAHDFNNLMTVVRGNAELLGERLAEDREAQEELAPILGAADRAIALTRRLLAFGRRTVADRSTTELHRVLEDMIPLLRALIRENVEIGLDLDPSAPPVRCSPSDVEQVLINLVVNASQAMPEGGRIQIATRSSDAGVLLRVEDEGCGMSAQTRERMFEPFFTTKPPGEGSGLGLAMVYAVVTGNGGRVEADSSPGEGSVFEVWWPASDRAPGEQRPARRSSTTDRRSQVVLVVEDEPLVRRTARRLLRRHGYEVMEAGDGDEALGLLREDHHVDLVLSDVVMPGMGGRELLRRVREQGRWVPFVLVSGYDEEGFDPEALAVEHAIFLDKPYARDELLEALDRALSLVPAAVVS